jgi:glucokinase
MPQTPPVAGIDLGGTNIQIGVVDEANAIIGRAKLKTRADKGPDAVIARIIEGLNEACVKAGVRPADLRAIGVGAPGAIDTARGVVVEAPNLRWNNLNLAQRLRAAANNTPVLVDNDVNAAVYGENRLGAGGNAADLLGVWIGTGIGGGLILNGSLYRGALGTAGEIGQTTLFPGAPLGWRTLEQNCSRSHIANRLQRLIDANNPSSLAARADISELGATPIAEAYRAGDPLVRRVVDEATGLLAVSVASAVTLLSLPLVILGGGWAEAFGEDLAQSLKEKMTPHLFPASLRECRVAVTTLADDAGLLGAALLARHNA